RGRGGGGGGGGVWRGGRDLAGRAGRGGDPAFFGGRQADLGGGGDLGEGTAAGRLLPEPHPGVVHGVGERPVPYAGTQGPVPGNVPDSGEIRGVRYPHRQFHPGLHARREQDIVRHPPPRARRAAG